MYAFYQSAMVISLVMSLCMAILTWRRRLFPGARAITVLAAATFVWTLGFLLEANSDTLQRQLFFSSIGYVGSMSVPVAWFVFARQYTGGGKALKAWRRVLPLCAVPLATVVLVWTNAWHHLMWSNEHLTTSGPFLVTVKTYGPFFWGALAYNYALVLTGAIFLIRRLFVGAPLYRGQLVSLIVAVGLPLLWNIVYVFGLAPLPRKDLTPAAFAVSATAIVIGLVHFRLLEVVPFAHKFIVEQLSDAVLVFDSHDRLLEANPVALKTVGADAGIIGKGLKDLSHSSPLLAQLSPIESGRTELSLTVSGENHFYELETRPMTGNQGRQVGWLAILHETTESKRMQEQLVAQDRLASVGRLASGIAHEINNPLTPLLGFSELLLKQDLPDDIKAGLDIVRDSTERIASIVTKLLTFARQSEPSRSPCRINDIVDSAVQLWAYQLEKDGIRLAKEYDPHLPQTLADAAQLQQVFLNLITNAEQAMSEYHGGGSLIVKTENTGNAIRLSVKDDGPGISRENMQKLFTPFFTTKKVGEGTGLGLSICHGIVASHGGRIYAESIEGEGATFIVELPVVNPV